MEKVYNIAVVGAGPAGIATSCEAVAFGIKDILVLEKSMNHSDTIRKYFKDMKPVDKDWKGIKVDLKGHIDFKGGTKETTLDLFDDSLEKNLIQANFETEVTNIKKEAGLFKLFTNKDREFMAKNIVIAIGTMGKPNKPSYKIPSSLRQKANHNIRLCTQDEKILVVGGGDSACEYAYFIHEKNDVTLTYRKDTITRANPKNVENLLQANKNGKLGLKLGIDIDHLEDKDGKFEVHYVNDDVEYYDRIIYALGGSSPKEFLLNSGVLLDENEKPIVKDGNFNSEGIYVAGDIAGSFGGSIASALNHGYQIITNMKNLEKVAS